MDSAVLSGFLARYPGSSVAESTLSIPASPNGLRAERLQAIPAWSLAEIPEGATESPEVSEELERLAAETADAKEFARLGADIRLEHRGA